MAEQLHHELWRRARQNDGGAAQGQVHFHDHGAHAVAIAQVFFGDHFATSQTTFHPAALDDDVALVHALDRADKNFVATRQKVVEQHLALGVTDFLQDDLLGRHGTNAANRQRFHALFDVLTHLDIRHAIGGVHEQFFSIRVLQTGLVGHHHPAAKGFVITTVAVDCHADVHVALKQLFGGLGQGQFDRPKHHIALDIFLSRDGIHQHQHFAVHDL